MHTVTTSREGLLRFGFSELEKPKWQIKKRYYPLRSSTDPKKIKLVEITEEQYQAIYPEIWATIKREQRHGRCRCPANYLWTCNGYCSDCSYHTVGNEESIDELTDTELSDEKPLMDELMACDQMLKLLVARFRELEPEADLIIELLEEGLSDRKIAETLGRKQRTFADHMKKIRTELHNLNR